MKRFAKYLIAPALPALFLVLLMAVPACAEPWSFAVIADSRSEWDGYRCVLDQLKSNQPLDPKFPPPRFVAALGDIDPLPKTVSIYNEIMGSGVAFVPVRGNHESAADFDFMLKQVLPAIKFPIKYYDGSSATYYFDCNNVRFISIDTYTTYAKGLKNAAFLDWVEKAISSAHKADHVFIAFHEPYMPVEASKDPFWSMLLRHGGKVRAVLCGHTHVYERRFVSGKNGGVHYINAGNAGNMRHSDYNLSLLEVSVDGKDVVFRTIQSSGWSRNFKVTDQWPAASPGK